MARPKKQPEAEQQPNVEANSEAPAVKDAPKKETVNKKYAVFKVIPKKVNGEWEYDKAALKPERYSYITEIDAQILNAQSMNTKIRHYLVD